MRRILLLVALLGVISPAVATTADKNLENALIVEWMVAHCDQGKMPAVTVGLAAMTLNGSDDEAIKAKRASVKERIKSEYASSDAACDFFFKRMK